MFYIDAMERFYDPTMPVESLRILAAMNIILGNLAYDSEGD